MNEEQLKQFMALLIEEAQLAGAKTDEEVLAYIENLGEEGIKERFVKFNQQMQGVQSAKLGAKLNYLRALKGKCPEGEELVYFKKGGRVCGACQKVQKGDKLNPIKDFKKKRQLQKMSKGNKA